MRLLFLAVTGGAIGSGARHLVNVAALRWLGSGFPWATLMVNVVGSFLMGFLVEMIIRAYAGSLDLRTFLATGILGGFTTFSAFSLDVYSLIERGQTAPALGYIIASVGVSLAALVAGIALARGAFP